MRRRRKNKRYWQLSTKPVRMVLSLWKPSGRSPRLSFNAHSVPLPRWPRKGCMPSQRFHAYLTPLQTQQFFVELGIAVGYQMQKLKARKRGLIHANRIMSIRRGKKAQWTNVVIHSAIRQGQHKKGLATCIASINISPQKALALFKDLADHLGWELYEIEE
jgi:hypothetical protein